MKKILMISWLLLYQCMAIHAQNISNITPDNLAKLQEHEQELQKMFVNVVRGVDDSAKYKACYAFIPQLVEALKVEGSYDFPFDSLTSISIKYAPDNSFRVLTWFAELENTTYHYYGAIQKNNPKELDLIALIDQSAEIGNPTGQVLSNKKWYGALYYGITQNLAPDSTTMYYTLFGWDGNNMRSAKKIADVLYFEDGQAKFGAPIFEVVKDDKVKMQHRFMLEFKKTATVRLNYDATQKKIIYDFLTAETQEQASNYGAYVPDGTYQAFEFKEGVWKHVDKVFFEWLDRAPRPKPVLGTGGPKIKSKKKKKRRKKKSRR